MSISRPEVNIALLKKESKQLEGAAKFFIQHPDEGLLKDFDRWLRIRNVINMDRICKSFYDKRLHYSESSEKHPIFDSEKDFLDTSLQSLEHIFVNKNGMAVVRANSYRIKKGWDAAKTLKQFLHSYTSLDCTAAINLLFNLTLYDVIQLIYQEKADPVFNTLFGSNRPLAERFSINNFGSYEFPVTSEQYFGINVTAITLEKLIHHPEFYVGMKLYVKGHPDYLKKHPMGFAQGWNVIFCGLSVNNEPLFMGARSWGKGFYLTYQQLINLMTKEYNNFPQFAERTHANLQATNKNMDGLCGYGAYFNIESLLELANIEELSRSLSRFIADNPRDVQMECEFLNHEGTPYKDVFATPQQIIKDKNKPFTSLDSNVNLHILKSKKIQSAVEKQVLNPFHLFKDLPLDSCVGEEKQIKHAHGKKRKR